MKKLLILPIAMALSTAAWAAPQAEEAPAPQESSDELAGAAATDYSKVEIVSTVAAGVAAAAALYSVAGDSSSDGDGGSDGTGGTSGTSGTSGTGG